MNEHAHDHEGHHPDAKTYLFVFLGLLVLTMVSFFASEKFESKGLTYTLVLGLSTLKTALVVMFFMHVKFEGRWLYVIMVPATILAVILVVVLLPDIAGVEF